MNCKKEWIAMLLAGGKGSRLGRLTDYTAKPAVSFGGKYKIIDFALSNCICSGIDTVGVLTQYQPLELSEYIGSGRPWDLDRSAGGLRLLPPYQRSNGADWYKGTANAVWQNMDFVDRFDPEYVIVLSGDHVYRMNYAKMLEFHKRKEADCTVATYRMPMREASRFGTAIIDDNMRILSFEEKPKMPKSNLVSMGVYIFTASALRQALACDDSDNTSDNDFGKNVIPGMIKRGCEMYAYQFEGYWRDVGTVESLWRANMDLLGKCPPFRLGGQRSPVYTGAHVAPPQYIGSEAHVSNSIVADGSIVLGRVENSVISCGAFVDVGAVVTNSVVMEGAHVSRAARVDHSVVDKYVRIPEGATVGSFSGEHGKITVVSRDTFLAAERTEKPEIPVQEIR